MTQFQRSKYAAVTFFSASLFALGASAADPSAPECYRSTECEGNLVCLDKACVASDEPQTVCSDENDCNWTELCDQGVCKPDGVTCTADYGICTFDTDKKGCICDDGESFSATEPNVGAGDTEAPKTDEELYNQCAERAAGCGAAPDLDEVCTEAQLAECTDLMNLYFTLEDNCSGDDVDTPTTAGDPGSSDGDADIPTARAENHPEVGPSELAGCCEELTEIENGDEPEEAAFIDCITVLEPDDCDGFAECGDLYGQSDDGGDTLEGAGDDGKDADERDDNDAVTSDAGTDGCQFVPAATETNIVKLIRLFI